MDRARSVDGVWHPRGAKWWAIAVVMAGVVMSGCVLKSTHCELVGHLDHAASNYDALATRSGDASDQADAKQMKATVQAAMDRCR